MISDNNKNNNFKSLGIFELKMRDGVQLFPIDYNVLDDISIKDKIKAIKIVIKSAFGGNKTYINQIMIYENTFQEINNIDESIQNININHEEINLPGDLSNSHISIEEKEKYINSNGNNKPKKEINIKKKINNLNPNIQNKKKNFEKIIKQQNNIKELPDSKSKNLEIKEHKNNIKKNKEENKNFLDKYENENEEEEDEENEENEENEEINEIIPTSNELQSPNINKFGTNYSSNNKNYNQNNEKEINEKLNKNENIIQRNKSKKVKKLEKILKQNILRNDCKVNENIIYSDNINMEQIEILDRNINNKNKVNYMNNNTINNVSNYPSLIPKIKNNYNNQNDKIERNSRVKDNNIQKYFKINANTPNLFTVNGYDYLINKKRPNTPKLNEININRNTVPLPNKNEYKNKTSMEGFIKNINNINNDIKNNKTYETLEIQLQDMEQHLENMALNGGFLSNPNNNYISKTNRANKIDNTKYLNNDIHINNNYIDKKTKNQSMISNASSYMNDEQKNINANNIVNNIYNNPNKNYFNKYYSPNLNFNNDDDNLEMNKRIDNLEKNIFEIKDELNNISSNLKLFLNKDSFLYNFRDSIKQICYDYFTERMNINKSEQINDGNYNENEEEEENSQYSEEYSETKNKKNGNNKIEEEINKKIDEKLEFLSDNLKNQIFEKYLQPSINEIEKSMRQNIEDIKDKVDSITNTNNSTVINKYDKYYNKTFDDESNNEIYKGSIELKNKYGKQNSKGDIYFKTSSKLKKEKYEEIDRLGAKLYDKLMEKERKLKILNQTTMKSMENNIIEE